MPVPHNIVVFAPYALWGHHFCTDLEIIQNHMDAGDNVTVLVCDGEMRSCETNVHHDLMACARCVGIRRAGLKLLSGDVQMESYYRLTRADAAELKRLQTEFDSIQELKSYRVDQFDLGMAALSSLVSAIRDPDPDLRQHAELLRTILRTAWTSYRSFQHYLRSHRVDRVYTFNARFAPLRGVLRACQEQGTECIIHDRGRDVQHYELYSNTLPHDEELFHQRIHNAWEKARDDPQRETVASNWFEERAKGVAQSWFSFVTDQRQGQLPADWNPAKYNVVLFASSEDEFVAINDCKSESIYPSQIEAVRAVIKSLSETPHNLHLYLRIHPNLANVDNQQTRDFDQLRAPFLTVIGARDSTSTYSLIQAANKVVTFRSTVGIESVYWGTPSILVGRSFYRDLGGTYNPATHKELLQLIQADLPAKDRTPALMYGYYSATRGTPFKHVEAVDFYDGLFKGQEFRIGRLDRIKMWLIKRPRSARRRLQQLATMLRGESSSQRAA